MSKFSVANLKKTIYYLRRNGIRDTILAARERLTSAEHYSPEMLSEEQKEAFRQEVKAWMEKSGETAENLPVFSILVPAYRTDPVFLRELIRSVREQVYPFWELLILDASDNRQVEETVKEVEKEAESSQGGEVHYIRLEKNGGISENTNAGITKAKGDYIALLDHDDVLTPDALYEMARVIRQRKDTGSEPPAFVYSDEDKWDGRDRYYELHRKEDFNLDLLLSNNYICHFLVMRRGLFEKLKLRKEFDGAQDYDLVLRAAGELIETGKKPERDILHVAKVLYHWRCHSGSTAENPESKRYAYEAGRRALQDFADARGWKMKAKALKHVGFYRLEVSDEIAPEQRLASLFEMRPDLGAIGGAIYGKALKGDIGKKRLTGGRMAQDGSVYYEGLKEGFSGYMHRAVLTQDAEAADLRCLAVSPAYRELFREITGLAYEPEENSVFFDVKKLPEGADIKKLSLDFGRALRENGVGILWDPDYVRYGNQAVKSGCTDHRNKEG